MQADDLDPQGVVTKLFTQYIDNLESGLSGGLEGLCTQAGELEAELRRRARIYRSLRELSSGTNTPEASSRKSVGNFELGEVIGSGGMGRVYLAQDRDLRRTVAIKVLEWARLFDPKERELILNEARSLARLDHPGIVRVHEIGETEDFGYIVMEHLAGPSLADVVQALPSVIAGSRDEHPSGARAMAERLMPFSARVRCLAEIAEALVYCHDRGVLHRDIKPANVLFGSDGRPRLIDFGIAHLAGEDGGLGANVTQALVGTPAYLAPEQVESARTGADPLSDQFSFSVLAYNLVAGINPFHLHTRTATLNAIALADPPRIRSTTRAIGLDLERVIHHGLERDPADRYETMAHLALDLRAILEQRPVSVHEATLRQLLRNWWRKHRRLARSLAALLLAVIAVLGALWVHQAQGIRREVQAELSAIAASPLGSALEHVDAGRRLEHLERAAASHDRSRARVALFGRLEPAVFAQVRAWSERLRSQLRSELAESERTHLSFQQPVAWSRVIDQEQRLWPECPDVEGFRERGRLQLTGVPVGSQVTLYEQSPPAGDDHARSAYFVFQQTDFTLSPAPGYYRIESISIEGLGILEREFLVLQEWATPLELALHEPDAATYEYSRQIPRHEYAVDTGDGADHGVLVVSAYRITPRCVTRAQFLDFLEHTGRSTARGSDLNSRETDPAWVNGDDAMAYASWVGGRLPTLVELDGAIGRGVIDYTSQEVGGHGEWVSNLMIGSGLESGCFVSYEGYGHYRNGTGPVRRALASTVVPSARDGTVRKQRKHPHPRAGDWVGVTFRIAFSTEAAHSGG